jgi:hypothetical protein
MLDSLMHRHDSSHASPTPVPRVPLALAIVVVLLMFRTPARASERSWEPLILKGARLSQLIGSDISKLEVLAVHDGRLVPIPFQVDERDRDGRYALAHGPEPTKADNPGILDADDEVSMMISDLGPRLDAAAGPGLPYNALEIDLHDPLGGPERYAYIAAVKNPVRTAKRYVLYDSKRDQIETDSYRLGFTNDFPTDYAPQNRIGQGGPSIIDRFKVRVRAVVLGIFPFHLNENDLNNNLLGWKAGPIRVIRRLSHSVRLILGIHSPEVTNVDLFYRNFGENPFKVYFPWVPRLLFGDIHVRLDLDFRDLSGYRLAYSGMNRPPIAIGDARAERQLEDDPPQVRWVAISGHGHLIIQTFIPTPDLSLLKFRLYYHNSPLSPDAPESLDGESPGIGYIVSGWENISSGTHRLTPILLNTSANFDPRILLAELHTPPIVLVRPVSAEAKPSAKAIPARGLAKSAGTARSARTKIDPRALPDVQR